MDFARFCKAVGANIRRARWARGLTQEGVAAMGFTLRYFQEIESGRRNPTLRTLYDVANALGVSVIDLIDVGEKRREPSLRELTPNPPRRGRKRRDESAARRRRPAQ